MAVKLQQFDTIQAGSSSAVQISSLHKAVSAVVLQSDPSNVGRISIGGSDVTTDTGIVIAIDGSMNIEPPAATKHGAEEIYLDEIYAAFEMPGDKLRVAAFVRYY